jgi:hypothetical protein
MQQLRNQILAAHTELQVREIWAVARFDFDRPGRE